MIKRTYKELQKAQEKLRIVDKLTNCIARVDSATSKEIAYFIHTIIEKDEMSLDDYRMVTSFSLQAYKELFQSVTE